ncbi:MAG: ACP S-malonyltransferase [Proteobacteria bacterium]|nr:ACP S-malonyltransferase [Desulfocapsa sp.]MBU4030523.1 ACP S-malonyltransferase [Pseudomonadota bacterium]MBU4044693.1 ACP S-malonyltransferase [Pseudomonadota bacterium]
MNIAFLFPGQGAQTLGMGEDFRKSYLVVARRLEQASDALGLDLCAIIRKGPTRLLAETRYAQPAIFVLSYAIGELLVERGLQPDIVAGHSLGEFTAATFAKAISFDDALALVIERGSLMHEVNVSLDGSMMAVSGLDSKTLLGILDGLCNDVWIANDNAPSQVVLSGLRPALQKAAQLIVDGGGRNTWLDVAGPYHTPLLADASKVFALRVASVNMRDPVFPIIANTSAEPLVIADSIHTELARHMISSVNWTGTMQIIEASGVNMLVEVGPGRVMKGLALRNSPTLPCRTTGTVREFDETCRSLESR